MSVCTIKIGGVEIPNWESFQTDNTLDLKARKTKWDSEYSDCTDYLDSYLNIDYTFEACVFNMSETSVTRCISFKSALFEQIKQEAQKRGLTFSEVVRAAVSRELQER
ncbi:MAG: hypothetical protein ACYCQJ_05230 [Nitrososphaerales archaeon]